MTYLLTITNNHGKIFYRKEFTDLADARAIAIHGKQEYHQQIPPGDAVKVKIEKVIPGQETQLCFWSKSRKHQP